MLWLLAVTVLLLAWFLWWAWRRKQSLVAQFVQSRLLAQLTIGVSPARQKLRLALIVFAVACAMLALARPQWGFDEEKAKQRGLDIVVAIDTSRSMLAEDVQPNRLARAKFAALDLMREAKKDRLALVPFAGAAFLQCPLTLDEEAFRQSVEALEVGIIPVGGTALTEAIETALTAFKEGDNFKILVLFTDGEDHDSGALAAAEKAAKAGLKVFTIGLGTANGELLRATDEKGVVSYIKDEQGSVVKSRLNESLLQQIATATGAFYLPLRGANSMKTLYDKGLAPLPKSEISERLVKRYHERYQWPLALALAALLAEMLLPERKRVARADIIVPGANAELRKAVAALLLLALPCSAALASPSSARRLYENGQYKEAQREYERLLKKTQARDRKDAAGKPPEDKETGADAALERAIEKTAPEDQRLHFNAGAAAYKTGDLGTALEHFATAALAPDLKLQEQACYNLGNTLYRQGEQAAEADQKIAAWEKSVQSYEIATHLDTQDADAKYNLELVKKKLEELKQQQPKQNKPQPDKQDNQQKDKQNQQEEKQKSDSSKQQDQQQPEKEQKSQQASRPQDQKPDQPPNQPQEKPSNQKDAQQEQAKQNKPGDAGKGEEKSGEQTEANAALAPGQMSVQQAQQLLDSQKGEERAMIFIPAQKFKERKRSFKDW